MAERRQIATALGAPIRLGSRELADAEGVTVKIGIAPVVLQVQPHSYIPLERPEQLRQWEEDLQKFYGVSVDASQMGGVACETCSCGCSDDCGLLG
jgi:hypothetical protein